MQDTRAGGMKGYKCSRSFYFFLNIYIGIFAFTSNSEYQQMKVSKFTMCLLFSEQGGGSLALRIVVGFETCDYFGV